MKSFDVIVKYVRDFHVIVKDISIVDSLVLIVKTASYKVTAPTVEYINQRLELSHKSKVIVAKWMDFINPRPVIKNINKVNVEMSSNEYFNDTYVTSINKVKNSISSRESVSVNTKNKLNIILDPTVGIFRKSVEFDSLTLAELDNLTLAEMDYIEEIAVDIENTMIWLKKLRKRG